MRGLPRIRIVVAFRAARSRLARYMTGSVAVHGAVLAAVLIVPATRHHVAPIEDTMVVALAGPIAAAPPRGGSAAAETVRPTPPPPAAPKEAHTVREVPVPKPKEKPPKKKDDVKASDTSPAVPAPPTPGPPAEAPSSGPPGNTKGPAQGNAGAGVTATVGGGDTSLGWYGAAVKAALEAVWAKPYLEDTQGVASVVVTFDIARDGTTRNFRIQQSSGIPSLDRSAQRAVIEASPLPAVPPTWTESTIPVTMRFDLHPDTR